MGYHHTALQDHAIRNTAFITPIGNIEFLKVPYGLTCERFYFQSLINKVLNELHFTMAYLDNIIIFSETSEQHLTHIKIFLDRLRQANLKMKRTKCHFFKK